MIIKPFVFQDLSIQSYLIEDEETKECVVIDPPRIVHEIQAYIKANHLTLKAILETHVHADFISGAVELRHVFKGIPLIYCSAAGNSEWIPRYVDDKIKDGDAVIIGSLSFKAKHTPGHTPEHITWLLYDLKTSDKLPVAAFTGDFLFVGGSGRPDILGSSLTDTLIKEIHTSLFKRIADLPDSVQILPAHGAGSFCGKAATNKLISSLGEERKSNPAFTMAENMSEWTKNLMEDLPAVPPSFARNKKLNVKGVALLSELPHAQINSKSADLMEFAKFDFRDPEAFGKGHLQGAVNVPIGPALGNWLSAVLTETTPLLCILPREQDRERVVNLIRLLGCEQSIVCAVWDDLKAQRQLVQLATIAPESLNAMANNGSDLYIIDVRTPTEWKAGHLKEAHHIELNQLLEKISAIPRDKKIITLCGSGWRSSIAASVLQRENFENVSHLAGGMKAWMQAGFPLSKN